MSCRRTGVPLNIKARKDSHGFDNIDDYFPDSGAVILLLLIIISNGNRTEWSPIRSVIIRVITKSDDRAAGVQFVYHEYDYRQNWTTRSRITN